MLRSITSYPFPSSVLKKLKEDGFIYFEDLYDGQEINCEGKLLMKQCGFEMNPIDFMSVSKCPSKSALDLWQDECMAPHIVTFSKSMDDMLDGGITVGQITELCGAPGSGKTQLSLQLCVDVTIPKSLGGLDGEALYIETDSGFTPSRLKEIAKACVDHCQLVAFHQSEGSLENEVSNFIETTILQAIHYTSACGYTQLLAAVFSIQDFLQKNSKVKLIVVDSLAFPFRDGVLNSLHRTRLLSSILKELRVVALKFNLAVVVTNQLTTKIGPRCEKSLIPALGESFGHYCNLRVMLGHLNQNTYAAFVLKSVKKPQISAQFQIVKNGIRDCDLQEMSSE
ncbi:hypothetical protein L9F63_023300 [Diploptera punctata]|uniref:DNA repair protein RAD51 homolog 3 n=1 Tax=Diploptera punctata TaxID=6984 RepID=A0AAD7ZJG5_DIPPU|nr:hypothetical protein L9F63_023300 [Diploptera punctata]